MKKSELIENIAEALFIDDMELTSDTHLEELDGWDSVGRLGIIALLNELFNVKIDTKALKECKYIDDILNLVREELED